MKATPEVFHSKKNSGIIEQKVPDNVLVALTGLAVHGKVEYNGNEYMIIARVPILLTSRIST